MATFDASIVTPEQDLLAEEVTEVSLRTDEGEAAFLAGHTRLIGSLVSGPVRFVREDGTERVAAVHGGFVKVDGDAVVVLAPVAELAEDIDVERARRALEGAESRLAELSAGGRGPAEGEGGPSGDVEVAEAEAARRRAEVRIEVAATTTGLTATT